MESNCTWKIIGLYTNKCSCRSIKNGDIKFSAHETFLESTSSGTLMSKEWKTKQWSLLGRWWCNLSSKYRRDHWHKLLTISKLTAFQNVFIFFKIFLKNKIFRYRKTTIYLYVSSFANRKYIKLIFYLWRYVSYTVAITIWREKNIVR